MSYVRFNNRSNHLFIVIFFLKQPILAMLLLWIIVCQLSSYIGERGVNVLQWHCANLLCEPPVPHAVGLGAAGGAARSSSCWWWTSHHLQEGVLVLGRTGEDRWAVFLGGKDHSLSHLDPSWRGNRSCVRRSIATPFGCCYGWFRRDAVKWVWNAIYWFCLLLAKGPQTDLT